MKIGWFEVRKHVCTCKRDSVVGCRCNDGSFVADLCFFAYDDDRDAGGDAYWPDGMIHIFESDDEDDRCILAIGVQISSTVINDPILDVLINTAREFEAHPSPQLGDIMDICRKDFDEGISVLMDRRDKHRG